MAIKISGTTVIDDSRNLVNTNALTTGNYNTYVPTLTGTGASGTWGINITGNAATASSASAVAWTGVTGKPTTLSGYGITDSEYKHAIGVPRNNLGDPTVREMALFDGQFNNKTEFHDISKIYIETSTNNVNWTTLSVSDTEKRKLVGGDDTSGVTIPYGTPYFRIRLRAINYVYLNALYAYWSSNGHSTKAQIFAKHDSAGSWTTIANSTADVASWPGHLYLPFSTIPWMIGGTLGTHYDEVYVLFIPNWNATYSAYGISLYRMQWWGGYPAGKRNLYATDSLANATFPAGLSSVGALTQNGNQVLHAGNYNSYAPTLTGTGASGTWGINVTGNAATATTATYSTNAAYSTNTTQTFSGNWNTDFAWAPAGSMILRGDTSTGSDANGPGGTWWFQQNFRHTNTSSTWGVQVAWGWEDNANILRARNVSGGNWGGWVTYLNSANYNSYSPSLAGSGATGTWGISITGSSASTTGNAATATNISNTGTVTLATATESNAITVTAPTYSTDQPVKLLNFDWYGNVFSLGNIRSGGTPTNGFGFYFTPSGGSRTEIARFGTGGSFNAVGAITQNGNQVLHAGNYNSYAPTLTGTGASGTWGINITGTASNVTGTVAIANGGTGQTTKTEAFDALAPTTTKGDLIVSNGSDNVRLPVGTNNYVLTADSAQASGVKWAAAGATLSGQTDAASPFETSLGSGAGAVNTGTNNTFIGFEAGNDNTTGVQNTAVGYQALDVNATGSYNTAIGKNALGATVIHSYCTAVGTDALALSTNNANTAVGAFAGSAITSGDYNTMVGALALRSATTGVRNSAVGYLAAGSVTTGSELTAVGYYSMGQNTTGAYNTALGSESLRLNTIGASNTAIGYNSLINNTTGSNNTAVGANALVSNTTGSPNVAIGYKAVFTNTTGQNLIGIGYEAAFSNTTGVDNTAVGMRALRGNSVGLQNVAVGNEALFSAQSSWSTAVGFNSLSSATTGASNSAVGYFAGAYITTGSNNTVIGRSAAASGTNNLTTGSNNVLIGFNATASSATVSNETTIGNSSTTAFRLFGDLKLQQDYTERVLTANTGTGFSIYLLEGTLQIFTLTGNCTFTFPTAVAGKSFTIFLKQDATGSRTVTWPASVKWPGGTAPTITSTASKLDKYVFTSDGTNWYGSVAGQNYTV